ncbi:hypothetical protein L2E82_45407 [Cichorium intybus]|uniref:Uncharacterized protein n=1 Tax=Cichorium intybus TaxID=13427 RepID=A0ACB8ZS07_CICIN|nr:hypothetical protein L2E82_45407 [Cichorium intybus]
MRVGCAALVRKRLPSALHHEGILLSNSCSSIHPSILLSLGVHNFMNNNQLLSNSNPKSLSTTPVRSDRSTNSVDNLDEAVILFKRMIRDTGQLKLPLSIGSFARKSNGPWWHQSLRIGTRLTARVYVHEEKLCGQIRYLLTSVNSMKEVWNDIRKSLKKLMLGFEKSGKH